MTMSLFDDDRKIPKVSINICVKPLNLDVNETKNWNKVFGYIMKKSRTKLDFLNINGLRRLDLDKIKLAKIRLKLNILDYKELLKIEDIFNDKLSVDLKAFILAILHISADKLIDCF